MFVFLHPVLLFCAFTVAGADPVPKSSCSKVTALEQQYGVKILIGKDMPQVKYGYAFPSMLRRNARGTFYTIY